MPPPIKTPALRALAAPADAISAFRRGRLVGLADGSGRALAAAAETLDAATFAEVQACAARVRVVLSPFRAAALGWKVENAIPVVAALPDGARLDFLRGLIGAGPATAAPPLARLQPNPIDEAAFAVSRLAGLLPGAVVGEVEAAPGDLAWVAVGDVVEAAAKGTTGAVERLVEARMPLAAAENARVIAFRPGDGGPECLAVIVGVPDVTEPVLVRIHSACLTGDVLGSLRCDCGDQLRGALSAMGRDGSGVLIYLPQEGRGIGLANKLRAYALQDAGLDTIDANRQLGFDADERGYRLAGAILRDLGIRRLRLMTNNPSKIGALDAEGLAVVERVPHAFPENRHNREYLRTKALRSGHQF